MSSSNTQEPTGRRYSGISRAIRKALIDLHTFVYRSTNGGMGGSFSKSPVLLLTTRGRKSGKPRTVPPLYLNDGEDLVLVASNGGAMNHPTWWLNLQANPEAEIRIKGVSKPVRAEIAAPEEKRRLWPQLTAMYAGYQSYQEITNRDIPVVILRPR